MLGKTNDNQVLIELAYWQLFFAAGEFVLALF